MSRSEQPRSVYRSMEDLVLAGAALPPSPALHAFVSDATANSGLDPAALRPDEASYSLVLPEGTLEPLQLDSRLDYEGELLRLGDLLGAQLRHDQLSLVRAVWALDSFEALRDFLVALRVLLRYSLDEDGRLLARVLPVTATLNTVECIERNDHLDSRGQLRVDSVTRMLGLRRKLLLLDYTRRLNGAGPRNTGQLGRTRSRLLT